MLLVYCQVWIFQKDMEVKICQERNFCRIIVQPRGQWMNIHMFAGSQMQMPEKAMAPYSSTFAWKIPWMEEPGRLQSMALLRVGHDWMASLSLFTFHFCIGEGNGNPLQYSCLGMGEPGGLPSTGLHRVGHNWSDLAPAGDANVTGNFCLLKGRYWV